MLNRLGVSKNDLRGIKETPIGDNASILIDPIAVCLAGLFTEEVQEMAKEGDAVLVVFGGDGWSWDASEGREEGWVEVGFVEEVGREEGEEGF